jgi:hypothetical protein
MSIVNFVPSVWAAGILRALDTLLVYANPAIINTDYEGEIRQAGDTVRITTLGDVTVKSYTKDADIDAPETLTDAQLRLIIDQQFYFNFALDDIDRTQALPGLLEEAQRRAGYGLRKTMDSFVAGLYTDISTDNWLGNDTTPITGFSADSKKAYNQLVALKTKLDVADTPEDGRFVVVPPWFEGYLQTDDRAISYGTAANRQQLQDGMQAGDNGLIGRAAGFDVYRSNQVPNVSSAKYKIIAGHRSAWSRAQQLLEVEAYRPERRFADAVKGLHVYGAKVIRPHNLAVLDASDA